MTSTAISGGCAAGRGCSRLASGLRSTSKTSRWSDTSRTSRCLVSEPNCSAFISRSNIAQLSTDYSCGMCWLACLRLENCDVRQGQLTSASLSSVAWCRGRGSSVYWAALSACSFDDVQAKALGKSPLRGVTVVCYGADRSGAHNRSLMLLGGVVVHYGVSFPHGEDLGYSSIGTR